MCVNENCATQAAYYMNAQLSALYDNAKTCLEEHQPETNTDQFRYGHALASFTYGKPREMFSAEFGKPSLEFACNHEAILNIRITKASYDLNHASKGSSTAGLGKSEISDVGAAFRVTFIRKTISGKDSQVGPGQNAIDLVVFDFQKAKLVNFTSTTPIRQDALAFYLNQYLDFLCRAGHHVLFSLPDFDDDPARVNIDFSLTGATAAGLESLGSISLQDINGHMRSMWLKATLAAAEKEIGVDWTHTSLAEFSTLNVSDISFDYHFQISFGAPRIKLICPREAVVTYVIEEVSFYATDDFKSEPFLKFDNWEISLLVDIECLVESEGSVINARFDTKSARLFQELCSYKGFDEEHATEEQHSCRDTLIDFFESQYVEFLGSAGYNVIYYHDERWVKLQEDAVFRGSWSEDFAVTKGASSSTETWKEVLATSNMYSFHEIIAVSQASLMQHFATLREASRAAKSGIKEASILSSWNFGETFSAKFSPLTLRLLSRGRALVWIRLEGGHLMTDGTKDEIADCHLAFEVDLKMGTHSTMDFVSQQWHSKYKSSQAFTHHGESGDCELNHIYLDFSHADFVHEFSNIKVLIREGVSKPVQKVKAVINNIKQQYFRALMENGLHILHTIPVWNQGVAAPAYGLTSAIFHVYSQSEVTRRNWMQSVGGVEPIIVILGMTGGQQMPETQLKFSSAWIVRANSRLAYGTISIARSVFVQERLLDRLARVNAATTIVPLSLTVDNDAVDLAVAIWAKHPIRTSQPCPWYPGESRPGYTQYRWQHRDNWIHEHEGNNVARNGSYKVSCCTQNFIEMPTTIKNKSMDIKVWGSVALGMEFKSSTTRWSSESSAEWNVSLSIATEGDTIKVKDTGIITPAFKPSITEGQLGAAIAFVDPREILEVHLSNAIDFKEVLDELRAFEGIWKYSYPDVYGCTLTSPSFNKAGDVIFEARSLALQALNTSSPESPTTPRSATSRRPRLRAIRTQNSGTSPSSPEMKTGGVASHKESVFGTVHVTEEQLSGRSYMAWAGSNTTVRV